jgi:hypothetical protein
MLGRAPTMNRAGSAVNEHRRKHDRGSPSLEGGCAYSNVVIGRWRQTRTYIDPARTVPRSRVALQSFFERLPKRGREDIASDAGGRGRRALAEAVIRPGARSANELWTLLPNKSLQLMGSRSERGGALP